MPLFSFLDALRNVDEFTIFPAGKRPLVGRQGRKKSGWGTALAELCTDCVLSDVRDEYSISSTPPDPVSSDGGFHQCTISWHHVWFSELVVAFCFLVRGDFSRLIRGLVYYVCIWEKVHIPHPVVANIVERERN